MSVLIFLDHRIIGLVRVQRIRDRTFDRFVEFRERPIRQRAKRYKETPHTLRVHDERSHVIFRSRIGLEVGNIVADPGLFAPRSTRLAGESDPTACRSRRRMRGCKARAGSSATTTPSWDKCPGPMDLRCRGAASARPLRSMIRNRASCRESVVPSSRSQEKPGNCWPALIVAFVFGSVMSASALPLSSFATSASEGCTGSCKSTRHSESGRGTSRLLSDTVRELSERSSPEFPDRACTVARRRQRRRYFHCSQRAELTKVPSFSANPAPGSR